MSLNTSAGVVRKARLAAEHVALAGKSPSATCITRSQRPSKALTIGASPALEPHVPSPRNVMELENIAHAPSEVIAKIK
jgi:hypothetical protein